MTTGRRELRMLAATYRACAELVEDVLQDLVQRPSFDAGRFDARVQQTYGVVHPRTHPLVSAVAEVCRPVLQAADPDLYPAAVARLDQAAEGAAELVRPAFVQRFRENTAKAPDREGLADALHAVRQGLLALAAQPEFPGQQRLALLPDPVQAGRHLPGGEHLAHRRPLPSRIADRLSGRGRPGG